jgi:hypothetical protein
MIKGVRGYIKGIVQNMVKEEKKRQGGKRKYPLNLVGERKTKQKLYISGSCNTREEIWTTSQDSQQFLPPLGQRKNDPKTSGPLLLEDGVIKLVIL